jgi:hypothetical protein
MIIGMDNHLGTGRCFARGLMWAPVSNTLSMTRVAVMLDVQTQFDVLHWVGMSFG